jgi:outer membrane protein assembly factor BamB
MNRRFRAILGLLGVFTATASAGADALIDPAALRQAEYSAFWEAQLPLREGDGATGIHLVDDNLYVTTTEGEVLAIHPGAGLLRWARRVTQRTFTIFPPTHIVNDTGTGPVVFATTTTLTVLDRYSGDPLASAPPQFAIGSGAAGYVVRAQDDDETDVQLYRLIVGSSDGHVYAVQWKLPTQPRMFNLWRAAAGGPVQATPVFGDPDHVYCASMGGNVYCCTVATKAKQWEFRAGRAIAGNPELGDDALYVASADRSLYKLDRLSGLVRWRRRLPELLQTGPTLLGDAVYQHCPGTGLHAVDARYGDILWTLPEGRQAVARAGDRVVVSLGGDRLATVNAATGTVLAELPLAYPAHVAVNRQDGAVYAVSPRGHLLCARPVGDAPLSRMELDAAHATLNRPPTRTPAPATAEPAVAPRTVVEQQEE